MGINYQKPGYYLNKGNTIPVRNEQMLNEEEMNKDGNKKENENKFNKDFNDTNDNDINFYKINIDKTINNNVIQDEKKNTLNEEKNKMKPDTCEGKFIGINIGSLKTVYSLFSNIGKEYLKKVLESDSSKRSFPSKICYTDSHRLFGFSSQPYIKKFINSSYNNLSRLIGFDECEIYIKELPFMINPVESFEKVNFNFPKKNETEKLTSINILVDYLSLINEFLNINNNQNIINFTIPVPDYYTLYQREHLKIINEALNLKNINIINESSALTMYYGFTKYRNLFFQNEETFEGIEKILFIDFGHSKTSYILSSYSKNKFSVEKVLCNPYLGGRNLDEKILENIIEEYKENNNIDDFDLNPKKKLDILNEISIARNKLSLNEESKLQITNFYNKNDLDMILSLSDLNYIISNELDIFKNDLLNIIGEEKNIKYVEMGGEVMRTQMLEKIIKDNFDLGLEKKISLDESLSVGGAISGFYFKNLHTKDENLIDNFYEYNYYNIYYSILNSNNSISDSKQIAFKKGMIKAKECKIPLSDFGQTIKIAFFYDENEVKFCLKNLKIIEYEINLESGEDPFLIVDISFNNPKIEINKKIEKNIEIKSIDGFLYYSDKENEIKKIQDKLNEHKNYDKDYFDYSNERKHLSKSIYEIKNSLLLVPNDDIEKQKNELDDFLNYLRKHEPEKSIREDEINKIKKKLDDYKKN